MRITIVLLSTVFFCTFAVNGFAASDGSAALVKYGVVQEAGTHLIHFDGNRFLGPYDG